jgi:hypothetical protein
MKMQILDHFQERIGTEPNPVAVLLFFYKFRFPTPDTSFFIHAISCEAQPGLKDVVEMLNWPSPVCCIELVIRRHTHAASLGNFRQMLILCGAVPHCECQPATTHQLITVCEEPRARVGNCAELRDSPWPANAPARFWLLSTHRTSQPSVRQLNHRQEGNPRNEMLPS